MNYLHDKYMKEIERYGGSSNLKVIEDFFCCSSSLICDFINRGPDIYRKIHFLIRLNHLTLGKLAIAESNFAHLYYLLGDIWLRYSLKEFSFKVKDINILTEEMSNTLNQYSSANISVPIDYESHLLRVYKQCYYNFNQENPTYVSALNNFIYDYNLSKPLLNCLISLNHMNANRLGIFPHIEAIIYKVMAKYDNSPSINLISQENKGEM